MHAGHALIKSHEQAPGFEVTAITATTQQEIQQVADLQRLAQKRWKEAGHPGWSFMPSPGQQTGSAAGQLTDAQVKLLAAAPFELRVTLNRSISPVHNVHSLLHCYTAIIKQQITFTCVLQGAAISDLPVLSLSFGSCPVSTSLDISGPTTFQEVLSTSGSKSTNSPNARNRVAYSPVSTQELSGPEQGSELQLDSVLQVMEIVHMLGFYAPK